jgi:hypothetical protein
VRVAGPNPDVRSNGSSGQGAFSEGLAPFPRAAALLTCSTTSAQSTLANARAEGWFATSRLHSGLAPVPAPRAKDQKVVFITANVAALPAAAAAAGAPSDHEPTPYPGADITIAMVRDPDGYLVELIQTS